MKQWVKCILMLKTSFLAAFLGISLFYSCSKKNHPSRTTSNENNTSLTEKKIDTAAVKKALVKRKQKVVIPKVISVNDSAAHKSVDGRLYYDVLGHRYWRNNKDGKYYLFNKTMYTDDAFKKPD